MKEKDLGSLGLPVGPVVSLVIVFWGRGVWPGGGGARLGCDWGSSVVCSYNVISCDLILFKILFGFHIAVESGDKVVFFTVLFLFSFLLIENIFCTFSGKFNFLVNFR